MNEITKGLINYEDVFIAIIEYIRDNPNCDYVTCQESIAKKFELENSNEGKIFIVTTINKVSMSGNEQKNKIINPDALFYLMEHKELKHSLEESKQAKRWAIASMVISMIAFIASCYFSIFEPDYTLLINDTNTKLDILVKEQRKGNSYLNEKLKVINNEANGIKK